MRYLTAILFFLFLAGPGGAQDRDNASLSLSGDLFRAGAEVQYSGPSADDLFMAGETVGMSGPVDGDAVLAGRRITVAGGIAGDLYAMGFEIAVTGAVAGDATLAGYELTVGPVGGDLRAMGSQVILAGPVAGYAILGGEEIRIDGPISGPVHMAAETVEFGPNARIDGPLVLYEEEPGTLDIPARVAPADRIERRELAEWDEGVADYRRVSWWGVVGQFLSGLVFVAIVTAVAAAIIPETLRTLRERLLETPWRALWVGFVAQSAVVGAVIILGMTLIGILLSPAAVLMALLLGLAGYVVGVYVLGVWLLHASGAAFPKEWRDRALAGALGALVAGLIALVPLLGWLFVMALSLMGVGAIVIHTFNPRFRDGP